MKREKTKEKMRTRATGSKIEQHRGTQATLVMVSSLAKKVEGFSIVGIGKACSNRRSIKNKYSNGIL